MKRSFLDAIIRREVKRALLRRRANRRFFGDAGLNKLGLRYFAGVKRNAKVLASYVENEIIEGATQDQIMNAISRMEPAAKALVRDLAAAKRKVSEP